MEEVDFTRLKQDVKFPLSWDTEDYKMYIFDANMEMVAQVETDENIVYYKKDKHPFHDLLGKLKTGERVVKSPRFFIDQGNFYDREYGVRIGCVRGWGRLQYKPNAERRQDNMANYIVQCLNKELV